MLTARELDVLRLACQGLSSRAIAGVLFISTDTIKEHLASAYIKLGAHNRTHAAAIAVQMGLIVLPGEQLRTAKSAYGKDSVPALEAAR